ncbi:MAG TPA: glycosyltransferase family 4 protein [Thermoanaerobaculia bacterium]|nr:glycosyltransferase family 4 protein [Thermoanaerobaculia bacterium]
MFETTIPVAGAAGDATHDSLPAKRPALTSENEGTGPRVGYVVKRYPRFSETFIVNEILANEAAGLEIDIFSLFPPVDTHFQPALGRVRAPVRYLLTDQLRPARFWETMLQGLESIPQLHEKLGAGRGHDARTVFLALQLALHARQSGLDHLHAHFATTSTSVARLAAHFAGITYSFTAHAKDIFEQSVDPRDLEQKLRDASGVITVSDFNVRHLTERFGDAASKIRRVYNGLDLDVLPWRAPAIRSQRLVAVGRLVEKKGIRHLIDACALLAKRGRNVACDIIGGGPLGPELRHDVKELGLEDRIHFLGSCAHDEVVARMREASALVAPFVVAGDGDRDGLPTVLLEAMAVGVPCISTAVTGIPEIICHESTGLLVPQGEAAPLADAIERLLDDDDLRMRLSREARVVIDQEFDSRRTSRAIREVFARAVARSEVAD